MLERLMERGKTSGRDDDNEASIKKRFSELLPMRLLIAETFEDTSMPVVDYYEKKGQVVKVCHADY